MLKQKIIKVCFFTVMIAFHLCLNSLLLAGDCADKDGITQTPTPPGNAEYTEDWRSQYRPTIYASDDEIDPEGTITLYADSGGTACPPYSWSVSGTGYSLDKNETDNDLETVTLTAPASTGTCGVDYDIVATVTVKDDCGETDEIEIKNTAGTWVRCYTISNMAICSCPCESNDEDGYFYIGNHRIYHRARGCISSCLVEAHYCSDPDPGYTTVGTCSDDGWEYTFDYYSSCDCSERCPTRCVNAPWRAYIDYWSCP